MSILIYFSQQEDGHNFLVSPNVVISVQTDLEMFEIREVQLIEDSLRSTSGSFLSSQFNENFRNNFLDSFKQEGEMKEFIFNHLTVGGIDVEESVRENSDNFFENVLYPSRNLGTESGLLYFSRGAVGKKIYLVGKPTKTNFPINFTYEFEREYLIKYENGEYIVEKI
jgi:hypothetical protein